MPAAALRRAAFLDRDGVINVDHAYVHRVEDFHFIDGIFDLVREARGAGCRVFVVTNQAGIARGYYTEDDFHRLSAWMCGARVQSFEVSSRGGAVRLSRSNAFIALSPYFLPIYSLLWSLVMAGVHGRWGSAWWVLPLYQAGLGFTYGFHVTMTVVILRIRQPDLVGEGFLFSASLIWLGNALILLLGMSWLAGRPGVGTALRWAARHSADIASGAWQMAERWVR